jgi:hypothetical protein
MVLMVLLGGALSAILFFPDAYDVDEFAMVGFNIIFFAASIYTLALGAGAFAQEKREQTLDLLRLTYMRPLSIFLGKMVSVWRLYLFTLALILPGLVVALVRSDRAPYAFGGSEDLFLGALLLPPILFVVMSFFGAMGVFYSLVSSTPIRAAFPSVATYLYISTMMFMWPMLIFQSEKAVPLSIAIGWGLLFVPVLAFVARTNFWKALVLGGGVLLMLGLQLLLAVAINEESAMLGTNPFVFASATLLLHERDALGMLASGVSLYLSSTVLFAVAAVFLLQSQSLGEEQGEENEWVAALLSLLMPGAGQFYLGDHKRGAILLIGSLLLGCLAGLANIAAAIDAYKLARARQAQRRLQETMRRQRA